MDLRQIITMIIIIQNDDMHACKKLNKRDYDLISMSRKIDLAAASFADFFVVATPRPSKLVPLIVISIHFISFFPSFLSLEVKSVPFMVSQCI